MAGFDTTRRGAGRGCYSTSFMAVVVCMTIDPRIPTMPGRRRGAGEGGNLVVRFSLVLCCFCLDNCDDLYYTYSSGVLVVHFSRMSLFSFSYFSLVFFFFHLSLSLL